MPSRWKIRYRVSVGKVVAAETAAAGAVVAEVEKYGSSTPMPTTRGIPALMATEMPCPAMVTQAALLNPLLAIRNHVRHIHLYRAAPPAMSKVPRLVVE